MQRIPQMWLLHKGYVIFSWCPLVFEAIEEDQKPKTQAKYKYGPQKREAYCRGAVRERIKNQSKIIL